VTSANAMLGAAVAMLAFAANSLLCRLALLPDHLDAASFTSIRLAAGAGVLVLVVLVSGARRAATRPRTDPIAVLALFGYMACFSFAYRSLTAGTGALILFGAVQVTMVAAGIANGERQTARAWGGFVLAVAGLVWLMAPGVTAPEPVGAALMSAAGVAWGVYSLRGRGSTNPLAATARNFVLACPLALGVSAATLDTAHVDARGITLAAASGAIASGLGYSVWYAVLPRLTALRAAAVQLAVPVVTAIGGVLLLAESFTARLAIAGAATLSGITLVVRSRAVRR
jgi:drug/metabolite transporter (DMT)-like permease